MKPIITLYMRGRPDETKKLDGFISAAFWVGIDQTENELESVRVRLPSEFYDLDVSNLVEFTSFLIQRQINFTVDFFVEPSTPESMTSHVPTEAKVPKKPQDLEGKETDFEVELAKIKEEFRKGNLTKAQYDSKKGTLLKKWKEMVETRLGL
jgi:hypothetical protein